MRRIIALLLAGMFLFVLALNCKDAPKDQKDEAVDTVIQETLDSEEPGGDTAEAEPVGGGSADPSQMKDAGPIADTIDKPEGKGHGDT